MASPRTRVRLQGILRGAGQEATCTVLATKVKLPGTGIFALCEHHVQDVSKKLPDGEYELALNGDLIPMKFQHGFWLARQ